jgi:hypothetical protein
MQRPRQIPATEAAVYVLVERNAEMVQEPERTTVCHCADPARKSPVRNSDDRVNGKKQRGYELGGHQGGGKCLAYFHKTVPDIILIPDTRLYCYF